MTGDEFKHLRSELKWSGEQLAERLAVEARTIRRWEASEHVPEIAALAITCLVHGLESTAGDTRESAERKPAPISKYRDKETLTGNEAADYLGVARRTLLVWKKNGMVPEPTAGRRFDGKQWREVDLYKKEDLEPLREKVAEGRRMFSDRIQKRMGP
jgi:DNA-binding transcriptional regulator YiaG